MKSAFPLLALALLASGTALPAVAPNDSDDVLTASNIISVGLASKDPSLRVEAIAATGMVAKSEPVRKQIEGFLSDKDVNVRVAATETLADLGLRQSIPALEKALDDPVPEVQFAAAKALYKLKDPKGKEALEDVLHRAINTKSSLIQRQKRQFLAHFYSFHNATIFLLDTGGGFVPVPGAGMGLGEAARLMNDSSLTARATVILILGRDQGSDIDHLLQTSLQDKDWSVRASAALIIALTARKELRKYLVPLFSDKDQKVRFRAAGAYLHLSGVPAPAATESHPTKQ
jgi:HEAT repeat protein